MAAVLCGLFAAFAWSLHDLVVRSYAQRIGPVRMAIGVMLAGGIVLVPIVVARGLIWSLPLAGVVQSLALGAVYGTAVGSLFKAFSLGPISLVGPLSAAYPTLAVLWGILHGFEPSPLQWAALAATFAGALVVARSGHADGGINAVPRHDVAPLLAFCLIAVLAYATSLVIAQDAGVAVGEYEATLLSRPTGALVLLPFLLGEAKPSPLALRHWLGIAAMAILDVGAVIAISFSGFLPEHEFAAVGISAYGAIAVMLAASVLKERVSPGQWAGIGLLVSGVAAISLT